MAEKLSQVLYVSEAVRPFEQDELLGFLEDFRARNEALEITGLLIYLNAGFSQIIEGPTDNIRLLYESILRDERHEKVKTLLSRGIARREFGDWSMAFRTGLQPGHPHHEGWSHFLDTAFEMPPPERAGAGYALLEMIRDELRCCGRSELIH